jgi:hypothetical protein
MDADEMMRCAFAGGRAENRTEMMWKKQIYGTPDTRHIYNPTPRIQSIACWDVRTRVLTHCTHLFEITK